MKSRASATVQSSASTGGSPAPLTGHKPTVFAAFLHFDLSFMIWVLLGALGVSISEGLGLSPAQKGLMVATPILSGSLMRIPLGLLSDRFGGRRVGIAMLLLLFAPLAIGWQAGTSLTVLLSVGLMLGVAGASFAVVLPLASRWYPPERQGLVMGIAAAGNSGTVVANLVAPRIAAHVGWHNVLALTMIPLAVVLVVFALLAKDSPNRAAKQTLASYLTALRVPELWWFCLLYSVTFGGYVGLSSFMPLLLRDQYHVAAVTAGYLTALAALAGSALRPVGGYVADRIGGVRLLSVLLIGIAAAYLAASRIPGLTPMVAILVMAMVCLGLGQRCRVPARAAVLPRPDRHRDGRRGCGRRVGRIHAADDARSIQAVDGILSARLHRARRRRAGRSSRCCGF